MGCSKCTKPKSVFQIFQLWRQSPSKRQIKLGGLTPWSDPVSRKHLHPNLIDHDQLICVFCSICDLVSLPVSHLSTMTTMTTMTTKTTMTTITTRLESCQKIYATQFYGQKFYILRVHKLQLFSLKRNISGGLLYMWLC